MGTTNRRVAGARAVCVQSLAVPAWLQKEVDAIPVIPTHAITVRTYAKTTGCCRPEADKKLRERAEAGELLRARSGGKLWYWPKEG